MSTVKSKEVEMSVISEHSEKIVDDVFIVQASKSKEVEISMKSEHSETVVDDAVIVQPNSCCGIRHGVAALLFTACAVGYAMRVNMSIAIVAMTDNETNLDFETFDWSSETQSTILSSFFWGYVVTQVPSGLLAQVMGAKWILFGGILINSITAMLTPVAATSGGWGAVCAIRVIQGLTQATLFPSTHSTLSKWAPPAERGRLAAITFIGAQAGTILALPLSGVLSTSSGGWPSVFYVFGSLGILWCIVWAIFMSNSPSEHRCISRDEAQYIESSLSSANTQMKIFTPWKHIFTSKHMWALIIAHSCQNWGYWTLLTEMPKYMDKVFKFNLNSNGLLSALPYFVMLILGFVFGYIADKIVKTEKVSTLVSRKLFNSIGFWIPAVALIGLAYVPSDQPAAGVALLSVAVGFNAGVYVGFQVNHIDLSPNFAGTMMGITNCISNVMSLIAPLAVGLIVKDETSTAQWRIVFWIAAVIYTIGNIFFLWLASTKVQPWDDPEYAKRK